MNLYCKFVAQTSESESPFVGDFSIDAHDNLLSHEKISSEKPVLIILHGLFGSGDNWLSWARKLSAHFTVLLPDARNHGDSPHIAGMSYLELAADLLALIRKVGPVHVIGHSMGGKTAMTAALLEPKKIASLVVVDIAPREMPVSHAKILEGLQELNSAKFRSRREADEILEKYEPNKAVRAFLLKSVKSGALLAAELEKAVPNTLTLGIKEIVKGYDDIRAWPENEIQRTSIEKDKNLKYTGPTLFLRGERSRYLLSSDEKAILRLFPAAKISPIENAGHWLHAENPQQFQSALDSFYQW